jgi:hypothetical protein
MWSLGLPGSVAEGWAEKFHPPIYCQASIQSVNVDALLDMAGQSRHVELR